MWHRILLLALTALVPLSLGVALAQDHEHDADSHEEHSPADHQEEAVEHDDHDGHDHADDGHDSHSEELVIELSEEAVNLAGIRSARVSRGTIARIIELPGQVDFDEDRLAHISPRFAGIARTANFRVGDFVDSGAVMAVVESNESMTTYSIRAPLSGWVIRRHITTGEFVSEESSIYVVADLSQVWVNLAVYPKDYDRIKPGQMVQLTALGSGQSTIGAIDYVTPIIDMKTRSATARVTLNNPELTWRPGMFIQATITTEGGSESLLVGRDAVQILDGEKVVFIVDGPGRFRPTPVTIGEGDDQWLAIRGGLAEGAEYVARGAFELKAEIVTSNLDPHAGHGH